MSDSEFHTPPRKSAGGAYSASSSAKSGVKVRSENVTRRHVDDSELIKRLRGLKISLEQEQVPISDIKLEGGAEIFQVENLEKSVVYSRICKILDDCVDNNVSEPGEVKFKVRSRWPAWQMYVKELDRIVMLKNKPNDRGDLKEIISERIGQPSSNFGIGNRTYELLCMLKELSECGKRMSKRALYYSDKVLFGEQKNVDSLIEDVAVMVGCMRLNLPCYPEDKGKVGGALKFVSDEFLYDCTQTYGINIPNDVFGITSIVAKDAAFILVLEKHSVFNRLMEAKFYKRMSCILLSGAGQPDVSTRLLLNKLISELKLPAFALVDCDPFGIDIFFTYRFGSGNMSYDSASLTTPSIKLLGVKPSHIGAHNIPEYCVSPILELDLRRLKNPTGDDDFESVDCWAEEVKIMRERRQKVEIEGLNAFGFDFLESYIISELEKLSSKIHLLTK